MHKILAPIQFSPDQKRVIKLLIKGNESPEKIWDSDEVKELKREIRKFYRGEQKAICAYCRGPVSVVYPTNCHIEHIAPKSLYSSFLFEPKNLCVICADCNQIKNDQETIKQVPDPIKKKYKQRYPNKSDDFFIVHPHFDKYDDHIIIINGYYIDKASKKGNFTIGACLLNRKFRIMGWEPSIVDDTELINDFTDYVNEPNFHKRVAKLEKIKTDLFY
jgi:uncharacterized protein (TIGR02646 family)